MRFQPDPYWSGDYSQPLEANPPMRWLLSQHPGAFAAATLAWVVLFSAAIMLLPLRLARVISVALILGHTWGASSWLLVHVPHGFWWTVALMMTSAVLVEVGWTMCGPEQPERQ